MLSGLANDGDIINLRSLTGGIPWGNTDFLVSVNEISISNNTRSFESFSTPLGDDKYRINIKTVSSNIADLITLGHMLKLPSTKLISSCRAINLNGYFNAKKPRYYNTYESASVKIQIRETTLNTGLVSPIETIYYKLNIEANNQTYQIFFNRYYSTLTKVEIILTGHYGWSEHTTNDDVQLFERIISDINITYAKSDEITSDITGGKAIWTATEI